MTRATATWNNTVKERFQAADFVIEDYLLDVLESIEYMAQRHSHGAEFAVDATSVCASTGSGTTTTWAHTNSGNMLLAGFIVNLASGDDVTGVTYAGSAMTLVDKKRINGVSYWVYLYKHANPAQGANDIVVSTTGSRITRGGAISFKGASQTLGTSATATGGDSTADPMTLDVSSAAGEIVVATGGIGVSVVWAPGSGETELWDTEQTDATNSAIASWGGREAGAGTVTIAPTIGGGAQAWALVGVSVKPAGSVTDDGGPLVLNEAEEIMARMPA